ncbi:hypothetical protein X740_31980 [Mesorhizobium sp. LNHC221B00]|nr:hypothetical protein X740_31980 [Mesorhizobium sp. LNHC221B00]
MVGYLKPALQENSGTVARFHLDFWNKFFIQVN